MPGPSESLDAAFPRRTREDWERAAHASLPDGTTLESLARRTAGGLAVPILADGSPVAARAPASMSNGADAQRGSGTAPWDNRLRVLGDDADAARAHALAGLAGGVDSIELETRRAPAGVPPRHGARPLALDALGAALEGVHLEMTGLSLRVGDDASAALATLETLASERGLDPARARFTLDADPLGELARTGRLAGGIEAGLERLAAVARDAAARLAAARAVAVDATVHHEAGASEVDELVAAIASATLYVERLVDAGLDPETACRTLVFRLACDADLLAGAVKLRALERLWRHVRKRSALPTAPATLLVETSRRQLSRRAPHVNHLRNTLACTAAAIGGADIIVCHPHDLVDGVRVEAGGDAAADADRLARNLPLLLAEECALGAVFDPAGGAHAIESLTQATVEAAWQGLGELQEAGGLARALADGSWDERLARSRAARARALAGGDAVRVGVNRFGDASAATATSSDGRESRPAEEDARDDGTVAGISADTEAGTAAATSAVGADDATAADDGTAADARSGSRASALAPWREAAAFENSTGKHDS